MKFLARILLFVFCSTSLNASEISPSTSLISSFPIPKDYFSIDGSIEYLDKNIDIFHSIKKSNNNEYGYIGKKLGTNLHIGYGLQKHISIFYNFSTNKMDYFDTTLTNYHNEILARINFYDVPHYIFDTFTLDIALLRDSASDIDIKNPQSFVSMTSKINPQVNGLSLKDNKLLYNGNVLSNKLNPKYRLKDLNSNSILFRLIWGNIFSSELLNIYTGFKYSDIGTNISYSPKKSLDSNYIDLANTIKDIDLSRSEKSIMAGLNFTIESESFIYRLNYEYDRIFSRGDKANGNHNHNNIFDINIAYKANRELLLYVGGKVMLNSYNNVIPYLYNKFTDDNFGKKYGYVKLGFVYNFKTDSSNLLYMK